MSDLTVLLFIAVAASDLFGVVRPAEAVRA